MHRSQCSSLQYQSVQVDAVLASLTTAPAEIISPHWAFGTRSSHRKDDNHNIRVPKCPNQINRPPWSLIFLKPIHQSSFIIIHLSSIHLSSIHLSSFKDSSCVSHEPSVYSVSYRLYEWVLIEYLAEYGGRYHMMIWIIWSRLPIDDTVQSIILDSSSFHACKVVIPPWLYGTGEHDGRITPLPYHTHPVILTRLNPDQRNAPSLPAEKRRSGPGEAREGRKIISRSYHRTRNAISDLSFVVEKGTGTGNGERGTPYLQATLNQHHVVTFAAGREMMKQNHSYTPVPQEEDVASTPTPTRRISNSSHESQLIITLDDVCVMVLNDFSELDHSTFVYSSVRVSSFCFSF